MQSIPASGQPTADERRLSILMPLYNERHTLRTIVRRVLNAPLPIPFELIVVDDGSTDGSADVLRALATEDSRVKPYRHEKNRGKGAAIRTAIEHMTGTIAVIQDADLEYDPADLAKVVRPILDGHADAVFGSRFLTGDYRRVLYFWHTLGNGLLTLMTNVLCDLNLTDMETCHKAVRADILRATRLRCSDFAIEPELTVRLAQWGIRLYEVPIRYAGRTYAEGKKITWVDGLKAVWTLLRTKYLDPCFTSHDGYYILAAVRNAGAFNRWMYDRIAPFVGRRVLEAGCGIGNLTELLIDVDRLIAADFDPFYVEMIDRRYGHLDNFGATSMNLVKSEDYDRLADESLDTIICLNVLEHIADDTGVLGHFHRTLRPGGHAIVLVPQHPWLYAPVDRVLGHERRYTALELRDKVIDAGFEVAAEMDFNKFGTLGWFVSGKLLGGTHLSPRQMRWFNRLLPIAKTIELLPGLPALSRIVVGRKPG